MKKKANGKIEMVSSGLNEIETPIPQACNLAKAIRMMSSSDEGIFGVAEALVELIECLQETRVELWHLACDVKSGGVS
jgi:precorrin-3B methylase